MTDITAYTITPSTVKNALSIAFLSKRPVFLWGPPGIGKSEIIKQIGAEFSAPVIDIRLSMREQMDLVGTPVPDETTKTMTWYPPKELPSNEYAANYKRVILFLDELNAATPAVQTAAYQLILDRKVNEYVLPDNVVIVAAGNRQSDRGVTYKMATPLCNRFIHLEMKANYDDWFSWAINNGIHSDVIGFLTYYKNELNSFDPTSPSVAFATPRSWTFVSDILKSDCTDVNTLTALIIGSVGDGIGIKFMTHKKYVADLPKIDDIFSGEEKLLKVKEISAMYSLGVAMCNELRLLKNKNDDDLYTKINNFFEFVMKNFEVEIIVMTVRLLMNKGYGLNIDTDKIDAYNTFIDKYGKFIIEAASTRKA